MLWHPGILQWKNITDNWLRGGSFFCQKSNCFLLFFVDIHTHTNTYTHKHTDIHTHTQTHKHTHTHTHSHKHTCVQDSIIIIGSCHLIEMSQKEVDNGHFIAWTSVTPSNCSQFPRIWRIKLKKIYLLVKLTYNCTTNAKLMIKDCNSCRTGEKNAELIKIIGPKVLQSFSALTSPYFLAHSITN